ncbi:zinc finger protein 250-like [Hyposmocoma kahamanoa]|uniref:zinc finger protein 250-like n=1 Tax=Hyposmocoma kahamanoa TaxID=1477025 RepID=UPI000E6D7FF7|nr:zinc finger protein 250-like [Hyposmocoma kahamanoa]
MEYNSMKFKLQKIKVDLLQSYTDTKNIQVAEKAPKPAGKKKVVLPASKLQPLPPDYVLNVANLGLSPTKILPKLSRAPSPGTISLKVTVGSSVLTQTLKTTTTTTAIQKSPVKLATLQNSSIQYEDIKNFNMPKDFLTSAVLLKNGEDVKRENGEAEFENTDEQPMEIDEDCTLVRLPRNDSNILIEDTTEKETSNEDKEQYFDVSILPLEETAGDDDGAILGKLQVVMHDANDQEDGDQTIVMSDANGSILRVMSGQKLVYQNGEITLVPDDENSNAGDDNNEIDGNESNDESQIELEVAGDEETANAIIAAAQEQGGAFIKVESGEMFRVKSVQSTTSSTSQPSTESSRIESAGIQTSEIETLRVEPTSPEPPTVQVAKWENGEFRCLLCNNTNQESPTVDAEVIMFHLRTVHDARVYICQICKKFMRKRTDYTAHLEEHALKLNKPTDKAKIHECNICKKKFTSRMLLNEHMNIHSGSRPYTCTVCNKSFASKYTHQAHLKTHLERPRPFKCEQCSKTFFTQQNLTQHEKTHLGIKDFICNVCGKAFGTQHNLEVHGVVHSGNKPFVCGVCAKAFARRAEVKDHMRIHTGERPFVCGRCGACFAQRSNLHSHTRATHLDDKRHQCQHCPKRFKRRRLLDYHIKASHTGERPLECELCHATFVYPEHYKKHTRIHSGEKPYVCEVCGKSFNSRDNRNMHRFVHSDKKPYECLVCGAGYMRKQLLYQHMNASGHLAESIVVNQPRVQKVESIGAASKAKVQKVDKAPLNIISDDLILDTTDANAVAAKSIDADNETTKYYYEITDDKKQDGSKAATVNLLQETDDPSLFTIIHNLEDVTKADSLQSSTTEQLGQQVHMVTSDENGGIRLVQFHIPPGATSWAINQE